MTVVDRHTSKLLAAIAIVESSRATHIHWAEYRRRGGTDDPGAGDLQHHDQSIRDYDLVLEVLRSYL